MTRLKWGLLAASVLALPPISALAQDDDVLGSLVVTAQKREQELQDVPFSVAAPTEEQIRNSGATSIVDVGRMVPGLAIADIGPGQSQVALRGISAGQVVRDQPGVKAQVGVYLDESPISVALFTPDLDLYDIERFEVLRGPQGTLFGSGSIAGVLRYITRQPQLGEFEGSFEIGGSEGTDQEFGGSIKGMVNAPLGETAALRVVGYVNEMPGFIDAVYPGRDREEDVNSGSKNGARVMLRVQPNDSLTITPRIVYQKLETDGYPRVDVWNILGNPFTTTEEPVDPGERGQVRQFEEGLDDDFKLYDLQVEYAMDGMTLTSISSYTDRKVVVNRDASQLTGSVTFDVGGSPDQIRLDSKLIDTTDLQSFSQEFRLASNNESAFQWLVGAFYEDVDRDYGQRLPTPGYDAVWFELVGQTPADVGNPPPDNPFFSDLSYSLKQKALFGEGTWQFNDQWSLTGGVRWYDFEEDRTLTFAGFFAVAQANVPGSVDSDGFSPRVILSYAMNDDVNFNAQVSRGFRLGGINDPLNGPICTPEDLALFGSVFEETWDDETAVNYEIGAKTRLAGGTVLFNTAVFYSDIKDLQANVDAGSCSSRIVVNVPEAHSMGIEAELFARPNENWDFGISATWVEAEIDSSVTGSGTEPIAGMREGNRLPTAPEFQAAATVTYMRPVFNDKEGFATLSVQHVGSSFSQLADQEFPFGFLDSDPDSPPPPFINFGDTTIDEFSWDPELPSYEIGNLRLGVRTDVWETALFINNIWDERAFLSLDRERGSRARVGYLTNQPRTYGVSFRMNF